QDGPGERAVENSLHTLYAPLVCILLAAALRHVRTARIMILDIPQHRSAGLVEPPPHARKIAHARCMRQIVWQRPDAGQDWNEVCLDIRECELDRLRWRRWLAPKDRGIQVEESCDEFAQTMQRCPPDDLGLEPHELLTEQPRFRVQKANERRQVAVAAW